MPTKLIIRTHVTTVPVLALLRRPDCQFRGNMLWWVRAHLDPRSHFRLNTQNATSKPDEVHSGTSPTRAAST